MDSIFDTARGGQALVMTEVLVELDRQMRKWGEQSHSPLYWLGILGEEVGEACKAAIENDSVEELCTELSHVAAVAVAAIESIRHQYHT